MTSSKKRIGILFGGRSAEHEVSIVTARNIVDALDTDKYEIVLIGIDKKGIWTLPSIEELRAASESVAKAMLPSLTSSLIVTPYSQEKQLVENDSFEKTSLDVVFPVLHGPYGEDGTIQGLLKLMNLPFVGASVLGSAVGMDKDIMKRLLRDAGIPIVRFITVTENEKHSLSFEKIKKKLGIPFFVKPANLGSSIGVAKISKSSEFTSAVIAAFLYDRKILFEEGIDAREIECSVLGNAKKIASIPGEILPTHDFYDYESKYIDEDGAHLIIPAELSQKQIKEIQQLSIQACDVLEIEGMARVDFLIDKKTEKIYLNEVNTIPGFTNISMYPKLWEASGIGYTELIDRLITLAVDRHEKERKLKTTREI